MYLTQPLVPGSGAASPMPDIGIPPPVALDTRRRLSHRLLAPAISLAVLAIAIRQLHGLALRDVLAMTPHGALFWGVFAISYLAAPVADWVIFRRLWRIPLAGIVPLLRKLIGNELLLGYIGEVYFYAWARRHGEMVAAPYGAIKDVTILSAVVGNLMTLAMLGLASPFLGMIDLGRHGPLALASIGVVLATSLAAFCFRQRLFSLPRRDLLFVAGVHLARIVATMGFTALTWHLVLPAVALTWWLMLATLRMLLSRLPLMPNKDIVFAGIAILLVGHDAGIATTMALMATLILTTHVLLALLLSAGELMRGRAS